MDENKKINMDILRCFKQCQISFKEKRFVFDPPTAAPAEGAGSESSFDKPYFDGRNLIDGKGLFYDPVAGQQIPMTPEEAAVRMKELGYNPDGTSKAPEVRVADERDRGAAQLRQWVGLELDSLQTKLPVGKFDELAQKLGFQGQLIGSRDLKAEVVTPQGLKGMTEQNSVELSAKIKAQAGPGSRLIKEAHAILKTAFPDMAESDVESFLVGLYASKVTNVVKAKIEEGKYLEFLRNNPAVKATYTAALTGYTGFAADVKFENDAQKAEYEKWIEGQKPAATTDQKLPETTEDPKRTARVEAFKKSWVARVMGFLGLLPMVETTLNGKKVQVPDFSAALKGEDPITVVVIGVCGGKGLLDNPAAYDDMVANLPDKQKTMVAGFEKRSEGSVVDLRKAAENVKPAEAVAGGVEPYDRAKFEKWINGGDMPAKGFKLGSNLDLKDLNLANCRFDLLVGGEMTLDGKATFTILVDGKEEQFPKPVLDQAKTFKGSELAGKKFVKIPSGTVFKGKIKPLPEKMVTPDTPAV